MDGKTLPSSKKQNINKKKKNQNLGGKSRSGNADGKNKTKTALYVSICCLEAVKPAAPSTSMNCCMLSAISWLHVFINCLPHFLVVTTRLLNVHSFVPITRMY